MTQKRFENKLNNLTPKREEVLRKVLAGESDPSIAQSLNIQEATVRKHIEILCKTFLGTPDFPGERRREELIDLFKTYKPEWVRIDGGDTEDKIDINEGQKLTVTGDAETDFILPAEMSFDMDWGREQNDWADEGKISPIEKTLREKTNWRQKKLFGIDKYLEQLGENLQSRDDYWLMSLTGAGGIGKTSLTEKMVGEYAADSGFIKLAWTTAKRTFLTANMSVNKRNKRIDLNVERIIYDIASQLDINLPPASQDHFFALQRKLQSDSYLIVIDNLETLPEYDRLLARFNPFDSTCNIRPSKVIFTSRKDLTVNNYAVREMKLRGLDQSATLEMIRDRGQELDIVRQAGDEELEPIYEKTRGNPLMIVLVINLLKIYGEPLDKIFQRFEQNQDVQDFLYEESVNSLSDPALLVLNSVLEFSPNHLISHSDLRKTSGLNDDEFTGAIVECRRLNLLDASPSLKYESRYSIHSLLYEFLRRENQW